MALAADFGERLKRVMAWAGVGLEEVAEAAGRRRNAVSEWRSNKKKPPWSVVERFCGELGWDARMFRAGTAMPTALVNAPVNVTGATVPGAGPAPPLLRLAGRLQQLGYELLGMARDLEGSRPASAADLAIRGEAVGHRQADEVQPPGAGSKRRARRSG